VGESVAKDLIAQKIGSWDKFVVIPPGFPIPEQIQSNSQIRPQQSRSNEFICAWIGRLVEIKSPDRIIEIAKEVKLRGLKIKFIVIGDGPLRSRAEEDSIAENLPITFLGWQKDVVGLLLSADALILTSLNEGTPISIIEAQRLGRPVVATNVGSVSEVIINGKSGFAIEYYAKDFVDRLELLSDNSIVYEQFSDAARTFAETRFSEKRLVTDHKNLYLNLFN
jgi:glycosyltransferase involved in cell wall biosynthesis